MAMYPIHTNHRFGMRRFLLRARGLPDIETAEEPSDADVDDRLLGEPKSAHQKPERLDDQSLQGWILRLCAVLAGCYLLGVHELVLAAFTSISCHPADGTVRAGTNVTCEIVTAFLSSEMALSLTQIGSAGPIALVDGTQKHRYEVTFSTSKAGFAGVRVTHHLFWSSGSVEVMPASAFGRVEVNCDPPNVRMGQEVRCGIRPRDIYGNLAEVERPDGAAADYFSVAKTGSAGDLAVHDTFVSFFARAMGRAGISVTLNGVRTSSDVEVVG